MKTNRFNSFFRRRILLANTAMLANATEDCSPFAILQGDSFFVPYGEFPHKLGLQKFDRAAADEMAANHAGLLNRMVSWARGESASYPVYIGHPDLPGSKDGDKRAYGWIENMVPEETGMRLPVKWSAEGRELVENAHFKFYSPLWWTRKMGKHVRPVSLKSMGLTNDPNIPVPALANEAMDDEADYVTPTPETDSMNPELLAALRLTDSATLEEVLAEITRLQTAAEDAKAKEADNATLTTDKEKVTQALQAANTANTALDGKLRIAANQLTQVAVAAGRLTPADVDGKVVELLAANDFSAAVIELHKLPVVMKTVSATGDLGTDRSKMVLAGNDAAKAAREERATLVANEYARTNPALPEGERKRIAWQRASAKNPDVFGKSPA